MPTAATPSLNPGDVPGAVEAISAHRYSPAYDALPEPMRQQLDSARAETSPVEKIVRTAEIIYAWRAEADAATLALGVQMTAFAGAWNYWTLGGPRGAQMGQAMRKARGESVPGYDGQDPEPMDGYGPPAEPPASAE